MDDKEFRALIEKMKSLAPVMAGKLDPLGLKSSMDQRMGAEGMGVPPPQGLPLSGGNLGGGRLPPNPEQLAALLRGR